MSVKPYEENEPKKEQVRTMFDRIAFRYDLLNRMLSFGIDTGWRRKLVRMVKAESPANVLDLATGTGDLAIMLAKKIPGTGITGVDLSSEMLAIAKKKVAKKGLGARINLREGDAEALAFEDNTFDACTIGFGVRNFGNIEKGIAEIYRVLKPGGRIYVLEFGMPENKLFGALFNFYFRKLLPFLGGVVSGEKKAYKYLQESVEEFPYGERFSGILGRSGFEKRTLKNMTFGVSIIYTGEKPDTKR